MAAVLDLVGMYGEINQEIMKDRLDENGCNGFFKRSTTHLEKMKSLLMKIPLQSVAEFTKSNTVSTLSPAPSRGPS